MRKVFSMDKEWKFYMGEPKSELKIFHQESYNASKAGGAMGAAASSFSDIEWQDVNVPHDWAIETEFDSNNMLSQGYKKRGIGWYRKTFYLDKELEGKQLVLVFDGISTACTVYFNGSLLGRNHSGYTEFTVDISDRAYTGDKPNSLAIRVDAETFEGWWYEGAGIYRHVWLLAKEPVHIAHNGIFVNPKKCENNLWDISIQSQVENSFYAEKNFQLEQTILFDKIPITTSVSSGKVSSNENININQTLTMTDPKLWDLDTPNLYTLQTKLIIDGITADIVETKFGCRTIAITADKGFFLNGRNVKIKGTCNHQDHAGVGVAVPDSIQEYRIRRLKEMGCNAYRCSHGNPAKEILDACDKYGILVLDENRNFESSQEVLKQVETMVKRDCNHPCIVLYSLFNEEPLQGTAEGRKMLLRMQSVLKKLDSTRPMLGAMNGGVLDGEGTATVMDITGVNYNIGIFDEFHKLYPNQPLIGSENNSAFSTRGCYKTDYDKHVMSNYDTEKASWGQGIRETWEVVDKRDFVAGIFVWTGFDYRGEPTPFIWPSISTQFGIMDTCGIAKDAFFFHKACWTKEPMLHILPHWNWNEGEDVKVMTVTNCEEVELFINGKSLGRKNSNIYTQCEWTVKFEAGTLSAKAYINGKCIAETEIKTAGKPVKLKLVPDRYTIFGDGNDTIPVNVCALDENENVIPLADNLVHFKVNGDGSIIGVGNGDPNSHEADYLPQRNLFAGWCQGLLQSNPNAEKISLTVSSDGLDSDTVNFDVVSQNNDINYIYSVKNILIGGWRFTPKSSNEKLNPLEKLSDNDMNSLEPILFGNNLQKGFNSGYILYTSTYDFPQEGEYVLEFKKLVAGETEIYLNDTLIFSRYTPVNEAITLQIPSNLRGKSKISVLLKANRWETVSGISGGVFLRY